jgi:glycolate oxidase FAD binding subunit
MSAATACETQIEDWAEQLQRAPAEQGFLILGGGTKAAMLPWSAANEAGITDDTHGPVKATTLPLQRIQTTNLRGIIEYRPAEFTITAYAGTPVSEVLAVLGEHGQYLPFESPYHVPTGTTIDSAHRADLASRSTIGGLVASGIHGPGRLRHGGLRDFILEVRYIDGMGVVRRGGRRVVKNAAGFDIPKLMVGSCGRLGVMVDVTFKVFPRPRDYLTLHFMSEQLEATVEIISTLLTHPWDLDAIEVQPEGSVLVRLSGHTDALVKHGQRIQSRLSKFYSSFLTGLQQHQAWSAYADGLWGQNDQCLVKVPLSLRRIFELDEVVEELEIQRAYGSGGNVAWLQWSKALESQIARLKRLHKAMLELQMLGQVVQGPSHHAFCGAAPGRLFFERLKTVFDPHGRLGIF